MLRVPAPGDAFCDLFSPVPAKQTVFFAALSLVGSPQHVCYIGSGAFGTVRLAWLQERRTCCKRIATASGERTETTVLLGVFAAVAVKRVAVPAASDGFGKSRRLLLLRELQVMERIRMHPHPNIVQCWGFLFGRKEREGTPDTWNPPSASTDAGTGGTLLTSLKKERDQLALNNKTNAVGNVSDQQILEGSSYVDLCLSLCTGGTLGDYVLQKARQAFEEATTETHSSVLVSRVEIDVTASNKMSSDGVSGNEGVTGSASEGISSFTCNDCGAHHTHAPKKLAEAKESAKATSECLLASVAFSPCLALSERDIVAIAYALINALRHTHDVLKTLHRDVKPSNVLIFSGVGKTPQYAMQSSSFVCEASCGEASHGCGTTLPGETTPLSPSEDPKTNTTSSESGSDSVEFALFSESPATLRRSTTESLRCGSEEDSATATASAGVSNLTKGASATLVVPLGCGQYRLPYAAGESSRRVCIDYLPQVEGWRLQLADFGVATGVGQLAGSGRCGSAPFMAPEVVEHVHNGVSGKYDTKADIYSLGVTLQHVLLHLVIGTETGGKAARDHAEALGAQWVDEDDTAAQFPAAPADPAPEAQPQFLVPNAWRCDRELVEGHHIRSAPPEMRCSTPASDGAKEEGDARKTFAVPLAWRCGNELLERRYIRRESSSGRGDGDAHAHLLAPLPEGLKDAREAHTVKERRGSRCSSCGKLHRHLVELLNAMTRRKATQRPPLSTVLQSSAIIEQGTFLHTRRPFASSPAAVDDADVDGYNNSPSTTLNSTGKGAVAERFRRARRRAQERTRVHSPPTGFRLDMTAPQQQPNNEQRKKPDGCENDATVLLWRPPSLRFLQSSQTVADVAQ
ncbi:putative protein kinase [Trypanosoma conorhini]|uniref:Protein kinase domain-containing protein n=1 Tax=Trypanosoma conorhini TaxID=83891 RepID=A0A422QA04_9TRYP|nr:putative protein kinase [Trypanosoma conorhini]RNF26788.1 putative protein kinase [Trypanosoma conorhini]